MKKLTFIIILLLSLSSIEYVSAQKQVNARHNLTGLKSQSRKKWMFTGSGPFRQGQTYFVNVRYYENTIDLPKNCTGAWIDTGGSNCGWSGSNPNNQQKYASYTYDNINQKIYVKTFFYQIIGYDVLGREMPKATYPFEPNGKAYISYCYLIP